MAAAANLNEVVLVGFASLSISPAVIETVARYRLRGRPVAHRLVFSHRRFSVGDGRSGEVDLDNRSALAVRSDELVPAHAVEIPVQVRSPAFRAGPRGSLSGYARLLCTVAVTSSPPVRFTKTA